MMIFTKTAVPINIIRCVCTVFLVSLIALHSANVTAAGIQKWVDESGKTHYGDRPPQGETAEVIEESLTIVQGADITPQVVLYSTSWCGYCKKARAFMRKNNIQFTDYDIEKDRFANARYKKMGGRGVPFLVSGGNIVSGFSAARYRAFFEL